MSVYFFKELNKLIKHFHNKIFTFKELLDLLITLTIVKREKFK